MIFFQNSDFMLFNFKNAKLRPTNVHLNGSKNGKKRTSPIAPPPGGPRSPQFCPHDCRLVAHKYGFYSYGYNKFWNQQKLKKNSTNGLLWYPSTLPTAPRLHHPASPRAVS